MNISDVIAAYDNSAEEYAKNQQAKIPKQELDSFLNLLKPNSKVLDAGCGSGRDSRIIKDRGFDATGSDLSKGLLAIAKRENPDIPFILADIRKVPSKDGSFDAIWANAVLHHLDKPQMSDAVAEFKRLLVAGGIVCVRTKQGEGNLKTREAMVSNEAREFTLLEPKELDTLLAQGGFEKIDLQTKESRSRPGLFWLTALYRKTGNN
ncbi:MAG TPA: class I SAM-dependent methyltransferase [Nitrososphaera sp.]|nr:class I SAM-dependent methyltransferase [Nitrososphaera sp.]